MNQVSGKVLLKETNAGIPDLLVEIYDLDPGTQAEEVSGSNNAPLVISTTPAISISVPQSNLPGDRLGSVLTGQDGSFKLEYEDADFRRRNAEEKRPDLFLVVRAPEEMDSSSNAAVLHISKDIRQNAGVTETYFIRIPKQTLIAAGLSLPTAITLNAEEPEAVIQKVNLSVIRQVTLKSELRKTAAKQIATERQRAAKVEKEVERRVLEKLTGVLDSQADRLNYVPPSGNVETAMFSALKKSIERKINQSPPALGYLILPEAEVERFKKADGTFRDDVTADELDPFLFGNAQNGQRPTFFIRENPLDLLRQQHNDSLDPIESEPADSSISKEDHNSGSNPADLAAAPAAAISAEAIPDYVSRLIETMTSPEEAVAFGVKPRATQDSVGNEISDFLLRSGPADVPAFYDFHSLQIAFDYVWQKAIDEGVIEGAKELGRQLQDLGGNPLVALRSEPNPIKALREELRFVESAHASSAIGTMFQSKVMEPDVQEDIKTSSGQGQSFPSTGEGGQSLPTTGGGSPTSQPNPSSHPDPTNSQSSFPPSQLLNQIEALIRERFAFEVFAPGSVNFGILVSYRQRWVPINYQVGNLIKTLTLTPKETRKVSTRRVVKKERSIKEMEDSLRVRKYDSNMTSRDEAEIIAKAEAKTNFSLTAQGTYNIGIASGDSTTVFGRDAATNSSDTKKAFREAVIKAAQEYKDERKLEVETKETYEEEFTESAEITNPNDELPVTYLFYELQRRFKISETIHRLSPVVLVAMDVPNPSRREIDALLLTYGWIIDRVLLDDQFRKPLEYLRTKFVGEEFALKTMEHNVRVMAEVVGELKMSYTQARSRSNSLADLLNAQITAKAQATDAQESEGFWEKAVETITGDGDLSVEGRRILEDAARERFERAVIQEKELRTQLDSETAALKAASDSLAKAQAEYLNCLMDIGSLRLHIKENILYYMQAIWSHTFKDHFFLALHKKKVPVLRSRERHYRLSEVDSPPASVTSKPGQVVIEVSADLKLESGFNPDEDFADLAEVADLDNLLGFKGNYLIFPLRQSNALTDFMMTPFVNSELGLRDPDEFGNWTLEEFRAYAHALQKKMQKQLQTGQITEQEFQATMDRLTEQFKRLLSAPRRTEDEITVPTGSLYIEALPGAHPILEDFKLMHRAIDVKKVQAEVRKLEMENIRYAARILSNEREDPDIDKKIIVEGDQVPVLDN